MDDYGSSGKTPTYSCKSVSVFLKYIYEYLLLQANPFWVHLSYFFSFSSLGFLLLKTTGSYDQPRNLDLLFTSVSASTVSSMSTVEMEVFSNTQLLLLTFLMFTGGEVFTSMLTLHFHNSKIKKLWKIEEKVGDVTTDINYVRDTESGSQNHVRTDLYENQYNSMKMLFYIILGYLVAVHVLGATLIFLYFNFTSSAKRILEAKNLNQVTFSVFTTVSSFANCGFVPTNENMIVFRKNAGLLLILVPQVVVGNTLFPCCLRGCVWVLGKWVGRVGDGYEYVMGGVQARMLAATVVGLVVVQMVVLGGMDWGSDAWSGMSGYEKVVGVLFQSINSRHAGENVVDVNVVSKAVLVLFVLMMYLPPYTSIVPTRRGDEEETQPQKREKSSRTRKGHIIENILFSQLTYLAIFVILICITERQKLKHDPLNFNVFNIVFEVISAYGNVGLTTGYSCARQLNPDGKCIDKWYGFSGKWSDEGKIILIIVMFFGRMKKFSMNGGKAWILM